MHPHRDVLESEDVVDREATAMVRAVENRQRRPLMCGDNYSYPLTTIKMTR